MHFFAVDDCKYIYKFNLPFAFFNPRLRVQHPIRDISTIIISLICNRLLGLDKTSNPSYVVLCCVTSHIVLNLVSITSCGRVRNWIQWGLGAEKNMINAYVSDTCVDIYTTII